MLDWKFNIALGISQSVLFYSLDIVLMWAIRECPEGVSVIRYPMAWLKRFGIWTRPSTSSKFHEVELKQI